MAAMPEPSPPPFDFDTLLSLPRLEGLAVSPKGRLVTTVARPHPQRKRFVSALWELDPSGRRPPRRLTRSAAGESAPVFLPDGGLLFTSARPDPDAPADDPRGEAPALWLLPAGGGEPTLLAAPAGGVDDVRVAREAATIVFGANAHVGTDSWEADAEREKERTEAGTSAHLFTTYPIRYWDHYLGPRERHLHAATVTDEASLGAVVDLQPRPGRALDMATFDVTPDGGTAVVGRRRGGAELTAMVYDLVAVEVATRAERVLAAGDAWHSAPACSPDGRWVVCVREDESNPDGPGDRTLWLSSLDGAHGRDLTPGFDRFPMAPVWAPDSSAVYFTADDDGHTLPFRVDLDGALTRLAAQGTFTDLAPAPDGEVVYALRSFVSTPPHPVALAARGDADPAVLADAFPAAAAPGTVHRLTATAPDGSAVRSWLCLPEGASAQRPAPLALLIHGGPVSSWTGWHWRWSPHLFTAAGYAVLLCDPALSTGYGMDTIRRGWGRWGDVVFADLMAAVDDATARPDVDGEQMAALGGSFGGYMANWVAGHTDRFRAIVTHASLWDLEQFHGSTDMGAWWEREFGDPYRHADRYRDNSPSRHIGAIRTPMLVIHGELDYRVPIGEALRLWTDLQRHGVESQFLYFPDEHHWVLRPGNARVWYDTVLAFLDHHTRGAEWRRPTLL